MKCLYLWSSLLFTLSVFGQNMQTIQIQADKSKTFNLSEIAEQIHPVGLEMSEAQHFDYISSVLWTNEYIYLNVFSIDAVMRQPLPTRVLQYSHSGKLIREIGAQGTNIRSLLCDNIKKLLFIPKGKEVYCYDFEGVLKDTYLLKSTPSLYNQGYFWIHHTEESQQNEKHASIVKYDLQTKKEDIIINYDSKPLKVEKILASHPICFSLNSQNPVVSLGFDNLLHQIVGNKLVPVVKYTIVPESTEFEKFRYRFQGYIGNYICISYFTNQQSYLYLKNIRNSRVFHTKYSSSQGITTDGIQDDMLATGFCGITPLNRPGYFYFIKKREELKDNPNISNKNATFTLFFVQLKP